MAWPPPPSGILYIQSIPGPRPPLPAPTTPSSPQHAFPHPHLTAVCAQPTPATRPRGPLSTRVPTAPLNPTPAGWQFPVLPVCLILSSENGMVPPAHTHTHSWPPIFQVRNRSGGSCKLLLLQHPSTHHQVLWLLSSTTVNAIWLYPPSLPSPYQVSGEAGGGEYSAVVQSLLWIPRQVR